jgi:hypothetical protein
MSCSEEVKDYGKIHEKYISSMVVTKDNSFLITASADFHVKKISIVNKEVLLDLGSMTSSSISTI